MTDQTPDLAALEALASKATPGPWSVGRHRDGHAVAIDDADGYSDVVGPGPVACMAYCYGGVSTIEWTDATAAYIAAADPATVLWLIREVSDLRAEVAELERQLDAAAKHAALGPGESCDVCTHRSFEEILADCESLSAGIEKAEATIERVRAALANHPKACEAHPAEDPISCGWKRAVLDVQTALDGGEPDA